MVIPKVKRVRLTGVAMRKLAAEIYLRDHGRCINCGKRVEVGTKFHHEPCGPNKSDEIEKGLLLCFDCHYARHNGKNSREIRSKCRQYLKEIYNVSERED